MFIDVDSETFGIFNAKAAKAGLTLSEYMRTVALAEQEERLPESWSREECYGGRYKWRSVEIYPAVWGFQAYIGGDIDEQRVLKIYGTDIKIAIAKVQSLIDSELERA